MEFNFNVTEPCLRGVLGCKSYLNVGFYNYSVPS